MPKTFYNSGMMLPFFVYGTLLPGQPNHYLLADSIETIQQATLRNGRLYDLGHYPMLVEEQRLVVHGCLITVKEEAYPAILHALDVLEGYDPAQPEASAYRRRQRQVNLANGATASAWVYIGQARYVSGSPPVPSGDWAGYISHKLAQLADWWSTIDTVTGLHEVENETEKR